MTQLFVQILNFKTLGLIIKKVRDLFNLRNKYGKKIQCKISRLREGVKVEKNVIIFTLSFYYTLTPSLTRKYCIIYKIALYCNYKRK